MKWLLLTAAALMLILFATAGVWLYLTDSAEQICRELEGLEETIGSEDWERAEAVCGQAEAQWEQVRPRWAVLIDHGEMEDVEIGFTDLAGAVRRRARDEALKELTELKFFLRRAAEAARPGWENIL